jgi:SHS family lactate transporter-like MFS transporter
MAVLDTSSMAADNSALSPRWGFAVSSGILGWILDAFDFFVLVFLVDVLAQHFHVEKKAIVWTITVTLMTRPVGAVLLGWLADRYGRRKPLIGCVLYFSIVTALTPFAPNYAVFVLLRGLYGIGMGGYWGIGASLVMESAPSRWRGLFSGVLQAGYSMGYLLAAVAMRTLEPRFGWQSMFLAGLVVGCGITVLTLMSPESDSWKKMRAARSAVPVWRVVMDHKGIFVYLTLLMTIITCLSHGTQDLYPDFLKSVHHFSTAVISNIAILYNVGAMLGALTVGHFSDRIGRRNCVLLALGVSLLSIPLWAFGATAAALTFGAFVMQFGVQGAFGIIPAHLNELAPAGVRTLFTGVVYQLGVLIGAPCVVIEFALRQHFGYQRALTIFECCVIVSLMLIFFFGPERRGRDLSAS